MQKLDFISISEGDSEKAVVFIHGWKGNKNSFTSLPSMLKLDSTTWYFPEAPYILEDNSKFKSWAYEKEDGIFETKKSELLLNDFLLKNVLNKFLPENIFFIGFSQGATVCYEFILNLKYSWGGIFPVAGFFRDWNKGITLHPVQKKTMIFIGHGITDKIINISESEKIYKYLSKRKYNCKLMKYNGGHKISIDYLREVKKYILNKYEQKL